jgi:hypothetical protein
MKKRIWVITPLGVIVAAIVVAAVVSWYQKDVFSPALAGYESSEDARQLTVFFCDATSDSLADASLLLQDDYSVVVRVRLRPHREVFSNGAPGRVTLTLDQALGGRIVRDEKGNVVPAGRGFLCPG